jgi:hypothetical protein
LSIEEKNRINYSTRKRGREEGTWSHSGPMTQGNTEVDSQCVVRRENFRMLALSGQEQNLIYAHT